MGLRDEEQNSGVRLRTERNDSGDGTTASSRPCHCVLGFHENRVTDRKLFEKSPLRIKAFRDSTANTNVSKTCDTSLTLPPVHTAVPTSHCMSSVCVGNQPFIDTSQSNQLSIDTSHSNKLSIDTSHSNQLSIDTSHSNQLSIDTSHSNQLFIDTSHSNLSSHHTVCFRQETLQSCGVPSGGGCTADSYFGVRVSTGSALKMEEAASSETPLPIYQTT